jgi:CheY-like chemotaxis protein
MRPRLVFIDDDPQELTDFENIVSEDYEYVPIQWPVEGSLEQGIGPAPAVIVLDMYFPPANCMAPVTISDRSRATQAARAKELSSRISRLYDDIADGKRLLRETFACGQVVYELLWAQCLELQQSPSNGRALLESLRAHSLYRKVPVVFYSRKVTVQEAVRALQAGAAAVIPKVSSPPSIQERESVLHQIKMAQSLALRGWRTRVAQWIGLNVNITLFQQDFTQQKAEVVAMKLGG